MNTWNKHHLKPPHTRLHRRFVEPKLLIHRQHKLEAYEARLAELQAQYIEPLMGELGIAHQQQKAKLKLDLPNLQASWDSALQRYKEKVCNYSALYQGSDIEALRHERTLFEQAYTDFLTMRPWLAFLSQPHFLSRLLLKIASRKDKTLAFQVTSFQRASTFVLSQPRPELLRMQRMSNVLERIIDERPVSLLQTTVYQLYHHRDKLPALFRWGLKFFITKRQHKKISTYFEDIEQMRGNLLSETELDAIHNTPIEAKNILRQENDEITKGLIETEKSVQGLTAKIHKKLKLYQDEKASLIGRIAAWRPAIACTETSIEGHVQEVNLGREPLFKDKPSPTVSSAPAVESTFLSADAKLTNDAKLAALIEQANGLQKQLMDESGKFKLEVQRKEVNTPSSAMFTAFSKQINKGRKDKQKEQRKEVNTPSSAIFAAFSKQISKFQEQIEEMETQSGQKVQHMGINTLSPEKLAASLKQINELQKQIEDIKKQFEQKDHRKEVITPFSQEESCEDEKISAKAPIYSKGR